MNRDSARATPELTSLFLNAVLPFRAREYLRGLHDRRNLASLTTGDAEYTLAPFVRHQCLFIHIPKTAGLSVANSLFGSKAGGHRSLRRYRVALGSDFVDGAFKFTVVRNPWDRLVSAFFFLKRGGISPQDAYWSQRHLACYEDFDDFVTAWLTRSRAGTQLHLVPQVSFLRDRHRNIGVDYVARVETLSRDFREIAARLAIPARLVSLNESKHDHYRSYYSERSRQIVADVYREDVEMLGYEF